MKQLFILNVLALLSLLTAQGQEADRKFTLSGEVRPRYEMRNGFGTLLSDQQEAGQFVSQRTRINANYEQDALKIGISLQDISIWGDRPTLSKNANNQLGVHQAWALYMFDPLWAIKVGRQELSYDDQRIFGAVGWAQQARSHDAALLQFNNNKSFKAHFGITYNQEGEKSIDTAYPYMNKAMQYLWLNTNTEELYLSFLLLNNGTQSASTDIELNTRYSQTYGFFVRNNKNKNWDLGASAYYQGGKGFNNTKISAYYFAAHVNKALSSTIKVGVGAEILSGTDQDETDGKNHSFNPLYGTNHKFNGLMDFFYVGNHANNVGLQDFYAKIAYKKNKLSTDLTAHMFNANGNIFKQTDLLGAQKTKMDNYLGLELDWTIAYVVSSSFKVQAGYSHMFASNSMIELKRNSLTAKYKDNGGWAWLMLAFTPKFLSL